MKTMRLTIVLLVIESLAVGQFTVVQSTKSEGFTGDSVLLPCSCSDGPKQLIWQNGDRVVSSYPQNTDSISTIDKSYINRMQLFLDMEKSNCSLLLLNVSVDDSGVYTCHVLMSVGTRLWSRKSSDVNLTVSEHPNQDIQKGGEETALSSVHIGVPILVVLVILAVGLLLTQLYKRQRHEQNIIYTQTKPCAV